MNSSGINIKILKNSDYDSNCYVVLDSQSQSCIVIDPGELYAEALIQYLDANRMVPEYILLTHEHFDHVAGLDAVYKKYEPQVLCSSRCMANISDPQKNLSKYFTGEELIIHSPLHGFNEDLFILDWASNNVELLKTGGHSQGSIVIRILDSIFTGDTMLDSTYRFSSFPGSSKAGLIQSYMVINDKYKDFDLIAYPGHGKKRKLNELINMRKTW
jgi:hydroxyacylglutathione hydrolase